MKKEIKKFLVCYNEVSELICLREHHFDWEEGDTITTNGESTMIFGIFEGTDKNLDLAYYMIRFLRNFRTKRMQGRVGAIEAIPVTDGWEEDTVYDLIQQSRSELIDASKNVWKDFDAQLDFIDSVFDKMEE